MNRFLLMTATCLVLVACKSKPKANQEAFFPVSNYLKGQESQAALANPSFRKIESVDSLSDTSVINKDAFRRYAQSFTSLPDIGGEEMKENYEESKMYDDQLKTVILTYSAKTPDAVVRKEDVMLEPDEKGDTHVRTIIIDWLKDEKDSIVEKNMVWEVNKGFFIITKVNKQGRPEKIGKLEVTWDRFSNQPTSRSTDQ